MKKGDRVYLVSVFNSQRNDRTGVGVDVTRTVYIQEATVHSSGKKQTYLFTAKADGSKSMAKESFGTDFITKGIGLQPSNLGPHLAWYTKTVFTDLDEARETAKKVICEMADKDIAHAKRMEAEYGYNMSHRIADLERPWVKFWERHFGAEEVEYMVDVDK